MTYLELAPVITTLRSRPEEFEFFGGMLHHVPSRHSFRFINDDDVEIHAACDCATLRASPVQARAFQSAYREWLSSYWRPLEINREFASHFAPVWWQQVAHWLLRRLLSRPQRGKAAPVEAALPFQPVS